MTRPVLIMIFLTMTLFSATSWSQPVVIPTLPTETQPLRVASKARPHALSKEMKRICAPSAAQKAFLRGQATSSCLAAHSTELNLGFTRLMAEKSLIRSPSDAQIIMEHAERLLLCPYVNPSPAIFLMRALQDRMIFYATREPVLRKSAKHLSCSMAWRGLRWQMMSPHARRWLSND